jgi:TonB family protein
MDDRLSVSSFLERRSFLRGLLAPLWVGCAANLLAEQDAKPKEKEKDTKPAPTVYTPGGDVKPPKVIHYVEPAFTDTSKDAFVDGVVKLKTTVTPEGLPVDIQITKGLNDPENHNAIEAVKQWRFQPGTKGGEAVHVRVSIEIAFHLM